MGRTVQVTDEALQRIIEPLNGLAYGAVQITVHGGQIVQIDRTERSRYEPAKPTVGGGAAGTAGVGPVGSAGNAGSAGSAGNSGSTRAAGGTSEKQYRPATPK